MARQRRVKVDSPFAQPNWYIAIPNRRIQLFLNQNATHGIADLTILDVGEPSYPFCVEKANEMSKFVPSIDLNGTYELAPNNTVNAGRPEKARSSTFDSAGRGKKPGKGENVCEIGTKSS